MLKRRFTLSPLLSCPFLSREAAAFYTILSAILLMFSVDPANAAATVVSPDNKSPGFENGAAPDGVQLITPPSGQPVPFDMAKVIDQTVTVTLTAEQGVTNLLNDTFDRPDSPVVGEGWVEVEQQGPPGATMSIANNQLFFDDTSDVPRRPLVRRSFAPVSTGQLQWDFDFDWSRNLGDPGYELWMQLGDSTLMVDPTSNLTQFTGVGVNLRWGSNAGIDQRLVARQDATMGGPTGLAVISGPTHLSVTADVDTRTYSVTIDGVPVGSGLSFDNISAVSRLDMVRLYTNNLDEQNFSGRTFDNLFISTPGAANTPPAADAGEDQNVNTGETVTLDGSGSTDADGDPLAYAWTLTAAPAGSTASLTGSATASPSFVADLAGTYQAELVVNDGTDNSAPDPVTITAVTGNTPPVADAGEDQNVNTGETVMLDGSGSTDADGDPLAYAWTLTAAPAGSTASLTGSATAGPSFVADLAGTYQTELVVNDGTDNSAPDPVTITAAMGNTPPVADAGEDQNVNTGETVTLDGSGSTDADGDPLAYAWTLTAAPAGSTASLTGSATAGPSFIADLAGTYQAELVVDDGTDHSPPDPVTITAAGPSVLFSDNFDRPDSQEIGPKWVKVEEAGASVVIANQKLFFADTSDFVNRPLVKRSFTEVSTGTLRWDFDFNWSRTGPEGIYKFLMQMGDGTVMSDDSQYEGAGVNLIWTVINGTHQTLGYHHGGVNSALATISGPASISVTADLDGQNYFVSVNGAVVGTGIPFYAPVALDTVRLATVNLNEENFSGRTIDNLSVASLLLNDSFNRPDNTIVGEGWAEVEGPGASVAIAGRKLFFADTSQDANSVLARRAFQQVPAGPLRWDFNFNWARTGAADTYRFLMQLGDGNLMSDATQDDGAGVNLIWTSVDGVHQTLGYIRDGVITPLAVLSGPAAISVAADLDTRTYSVSVNGSLAGTGLPFGHDVSPDTVRFIAQNLDQQNFSGHTIDNLSISSVLLQDSFDREDSRAVGPGWVEVEDVGASVDIADQKLFFADASDILNRPLVRGPFTEASTGTLQWDFDFDWARTGPEQQYRVLMQLGEGATMSDSGQYAGAGVNLVWTVIDGVHQSLGYRQAGIDTAVAVLSGPAAISVAADLDTDTYSVSVNGAVLETGIPFADNVPLDTVRFLTTNLNEENISGRSFDNVVIIR